jgi:tetratricopeptide (TPR) repeat protein
MKFHIIRSIAALFFFFSGSVALAQTATEGEACIQATQSSADALYASDWNSLIALKKQEMKICWWDVDPSSIASGNSTIGLAYYELGDLANSKIYYNKCVKLYYSDPDCHYWLAALALKEKNFLKFAQEREIARKIALRILSEGIPSYTKSEVMMIKFRTRIEVAKSVLRKITEF